MSDKLNTYPQKPSINLDYRDLKDQIGAGWGTCVWCGGEHKDVELRFQYATVLPAVDEVLTGVTSGDTGTVIEVEDCSSQATLVTITGTWNPFDTYTYYISLAYVPSAVYCDHALLTEVAGLGGSINNTWYYNAATNYLYLMLATLPYDPTSRLVQYRDIEGYVQLHPYTGANEDGFCFDDAETVTGSVATSFTADGDGSVKDYSVYWPKTEMTFYEGKWYCNKHFKMVHGGLKQKDKSQVYIDERRDDQWR